MIKFKHGMLFFGLLAMLSCNKEERLLLDRTEAILPGSWSIESVQLPGKKGITYAGNTLVNDTILYDIGTIVISEFVIEDLDLQNTNAPAVPCVVTVFNEVFQYHIDHIFYNGEKDVFSSFESSLQGVNIIDTPGEEFLSSSRIFRDNYYIVLVNDDHVRLERGNDRKGHSIELRRL